MTPNLFIRGNREPRAQLVGKKGLATGDTFRKLLMGDADISEIIIVNQHIFDWMIDKLNRKTFIEILKESKRRFPERKIKLLLKVFTCHFRSFININFQQKKSS